MNFIKKIIYSYCIPFAGFLCHSKNKYVNVIYYHDIVSGPGQSYMKTNFEVFKQQMEYIAAKGYTTLRFDDLDSAESLRYASDKVLIVFDDGWISNYNEIYDLMRDLGLKYSIYLTVGEIGANPDYLTWDNVRRMHEEGLVGFGVHTYSHPDMSNLELIKKELEFDRAENVFEQELGYKPMDFCYPFGKYSASSNSYIVANRNYQRIYTSDMMYTYCQNGKLIFGRNAISNDESFWLFKAKLKGYFNVWRTLLG